MRRYAPIVSLCLACSPAPVLAQNNPFNSAKPFEACVAAIEKDPQDAFENAMIWRDHGGGFAAEHCVALSIVATGSPGEGARRLDALARRPDAGTLAERARVLSEAGDAWLEAGQSALAQASFSAALKLTPRNALAWMDRARAKAMAQDWKGAESDLDSAVTFNNAHPQIRVLRAAARAKLGKREEAKADIDAALRSDPGYPDALVERGILRLEAGDKAGARADFAAALRRAPNSAAGDAARAQIERLELRP